MEIGDLPSRILAKIYKLDGADDLSTLSRLTYHRCSIVDHYHNKMHENHRSSCASLKFVGLRHQPPCFFLRYKLRLRLPPVSCNFRFMNKSAALTSSYSI